MTKKYNVAVVGASGVVGKETLEILAERKFPINKIFAIASDNSLGKKVSFGDESLHIDMMDDINWDEIDIIFTAAGSKVTNTITNRNLSKAIIIDKTSAYRLDEQVPLIVPEVNSDDIGFYKKKNIISNPNCCVIPLSLTLQPLSKVCPIKRVVISTYQSVSGAGKNAMEALYNQTRKKFVYTEDEEQNEQNYAFNVIAKIGPIEDNGYTGEENKIIKELQRILGDKIQITATSVRVPVFVGHSFSVNVEFADTVKINDIKDSLKQNPWIVLQDEHVEPADVSGTDHVFVSRLRKDTSHPNAINMWVVSDNLRRGAALNSVQIAEKLISML